MPEIKLADHFQAMFVSGFRGLPAMRRAQVQALFWPPGDRFHPPPAKSHGELGGTEQQERNAADRKN